MARDRKPKRRIPRKSRRNTEQERSRLGIWIALVIIVLLGSYVWALDLARPKVSGDRLNLNKFTTLVEQNRVTNARLLDFDGYIVGRYIKDTGGTAQYHMAYLKNQLGYFTTFLINNQVDTDADQQNGKRIATLATTLLPILILTMVFVYFILSFRKGTGLFAIRSGARRIHASETGVTFADVAGHDSAITELREIVQFLKDPERFLTLGARAPKGILLYGPPGCGKTLVAKALASESGAAFYSISGSDFIEVWVGVGAARVRDLFKEARENAPAIVFIDELDSIGKRRGVVDQAAANGEQEQAVNQILAEMDGFSTSDGVIVVGATNRPDVLDPALLRPGRFDRTIGLEPPGEDARLAILNLHGRGKKLDTSIELPAIAKRAIGLSGADLANVMNEGAILAARTERAAIGQSDLEEALSRMLSEPERQRRLSLRDRGIGRRWTESETRVTFADVAGQDQAIAELREIVQFVSDPQRYLDLGAAVPKGILLYGPSGCGKTLMARALAGEANAAFFSVSGSEFVEVFAGEGASRVRDLFAEARSVPPAIIFIDEIDAVGTRRTGPSLTSHLEHDQTLNQILAEMDGFSASHGLIVIGATNRPDVLDQALLRPGRFDRTIGLERPDENGRLGILKTHARGKLLEEETDLAEIARRAIGLTGADLANILNEAALLAARGGKQKVSQDELDEALKRTMEAPDRQRRLSMRNRTFGRSAAEEKVTFADVAGVDNAIAELSDVKDQLTSPEKFVELGARTPRGILLVGPPGCGKTLLARAVAGEANAAFFSVAATEFVEVFVGEGAARVRDLFAEARSVAPAIVFIDEVDAIGGRRASVSMDGHRERESTLNQILVELDGFDPRAGVIVMAATNRPDILDPALIRPGRFDRQVTIDLPDRAGRLDILQLHARSKPLSGDIDFDVVAGLTQGFSGADLANVMNEAALLAVRRNLRTISMSLIEESIERAILGVGSRVRVLTDRERAMVAYHEAGHALVGRALPGAAPPHKISIIGSARSLGHVIGAAESDRVVHTRSILLDEMATLLGGRVAEEIVFDEPSAGATDDLRRVSEIARKMITEMGMSEELGPLAYPDGMSNGGPHPSYSDVSARKIDEEVSKLVDEAQRRSREVLNSQREALERVAQALLERETLSSQDLEEIAGPIADIAEREIAPQSPGVRSGSAT